MVIETDRHRPGGTGHPDWSNIMKFIVTEKQSLNSVRRGEVVDAKDLAAAKRAASRAQMFQATVLTVEDEAGTLLAWKPWRGAWINA